MDTDEDVHVAVQCGLNYLSNNLLVVESFLSEFDNSKMDGGRERRRQGKSK